MSLVKSMDSKFNDLKVAIRSGRGSWIIGQGVNALVVVYPPEEEKQYLARVRKDYGHEYIIDLSKLFLRFIDNIGMDALKKLYNDYRSTIDRVFISSEDSHVSLLDLIIEEIQKAIKEDKMPVLIRSGILYGTHIRNNTILEHETVSRLKKPLILFYPGVVKKDLQDKEEVYFLGIMKSSDYRGQFL